MKTIIITDLEVNKIRNHFGYDNSLAQEQINKSLVLINKLQHKLSDHEIGDEVIDSIVGVLDRKITALKEHRIY